MISQDPNCGACHGRPFKFVECICVKRARRRQQLVRALVARDWAVACAQMYQAWDPEAWGHDDECRINPRWPAPALASLPTPCEVVAEMLGGDDG